MNENCPRAIQLGIVGYPCHLSKDHHGFHVFNGGHTENGSFTISWDEHKMLEVKTAVSSVAGAENAGK